MEIKITKYEYKKVELSSATFELPEETCYFFETGIRRSIRIEPIFTSWKKDQDGSDETLLSLKFTCVHLSFECEVNVYTVNVDIMNSMYTESQTQKQYGLIKSMINGYFDKRTKEKFNADLASALLIINGNS
jgi:hypothetical protein